jgi:nicotinate phosphoribosyltransferase
MPHALVISLGDAERAFRAYDDALDGSIPRTVLVDTFCDETVEAVTAAETLGEALDGVRLDTTASRRGDLRGIVEEVRWELDRRGYGDVEILVSGGIDAGEVRRLRDVVDGFGVGGAIADADPVDLSMNLVEVDGEARTKRGARSGAKQVYRDGFEDRVVPVGESAPGEPLLRPVVEDGEVLAAFPLDDARERVREAVPALRERGAFDPE